MRNPREKERERKEPENPAFTKFQPLDCGRLSRCLYVKVKVRREDAVLATFRAEGSTNLTNTSIPSRKTCTVLGVSKQRCEHLGPT